MLERSKSSAIPLPKSIAETFTKVDPVIKASKPSNDMANNCVNQKNTLSTKPLTSEGSSKPSVGNSPLSPQFSAPMFRKKTKVQEGPSAEKNKPEPVGISEKVQSSDDKIIEAHANGTGKLKSVADLHRVQLIGPSTNPFAKSSGEKDVRPANPFAKSSNNQDKSSLLDSIKKMKADGTDRK